MRVPSFEPISRPVSRVMVCYCDVEMLEIRHEWPPRDRLPVQHEHVRVRLESQVGGIPRDIDPLESV